MKADKKNALLRILSRSEEGCRTSMLANMLGISERTVRNYVREINEDGQAVILSSRDGYRLKDSNYNLTETPTENEARVWRVLSDLLTSKVGINAFDEADELYVSASTITNTIIPQIKSLVREECLEYLLRFEDPLTVVRDQWLLEQGVDLSEEFGHALWYLAASGSAEQDYPLDSANSPKQSGPAMC